MIISTSKHYQKRVLDTSNPDYVIITDPETVVVSVTAHKEESVIPETTTTAPEVITEKATEEGAEEAATPAAEEKSG
mgnify:CR=1 FL=1